MRILGQADSCMHEILIPSLEVGHARLDFIFPPRCHTDVAALNCDLHDVSFALLYWIEQQGTCRLSVRHWLSLEDSYYPQLVSAAFETSVMGDAFFLSALPPVKPNAPSSVSMKPSKKL